MRQNRGVDLIPTIDLGLTPAVLAAALDQVCSETGFFQIIGHGVDPAVIDAAWTTSRAFFDMPLSDRMSVRRRSTADAYGYVPIQAEALNRSLADTTDSSPATSYAAADLKETFNIGPVDPLARPCADDGERWAFTPSEWPRMLPAIRPAWTAYFRAMLDLSARLMQSFALALDLPEHHFDSMIDESPSALRAINYPHQDNAPQPGALRAGAHTDYGTLTVLLQDDAPGGLEVFDHHSNAWVPVPHLPGAFVVNIGDLLAWWTNDRWRSTLHRVVNPPLDTTVSTRRQSIAFFHNANYHCLVECLPSCLEPGAAPVHPPVVAGPHLREKYLRATS
jgi:isopenicillin N synthase-like dioxygenase